MFVYKGIAYIATAIVLVALIRAPLAAQPGSTPEPGQPNPITTRIVASSSSPAGVKADYVATGKGDDIVINQAILSLPPSGGRVVLLEGWYNLSGSIILPSQVSLIGKGKATQLFIANNSNTAAITNSDPVKGNKGIILDNFTIYGNQYTQTAGSGISFRQVTDSLLTNLEIRDTKQVGIDLLFGSNNNTLKNIQIHSIGYNGLVIYQSHYNQVSGILSEYNGNSGIWIFGGEHNILSGIHTFNNKYSGLEIQANNNNLTEVITAGNSHSGVYLVEASGNYIQGVAHNNAYTGFALNTAKGNTIKVWAVGNGRHGIDLYSSSLNLVVDSVARNNGWSGIGFSGIHISDDGLTPSSYNMIISSYAVGDQTPKPQEFGIMIAGAADYTLIMGNTLTGNKFGPLSAEQRHNVILNNTPATP